MTGDEIRAIRRRLALTQAAFAARLRTTRRRISDWEREQRPVPKYIAAHLRTLEALHECEERERRS